MASAVTASHASNGDLFVNWAPGDSANKTVLLPIVDDTLDESNETLSLQVTPLSVGATAGTPASATLTIVDNDPSPSITISNVSILEPNASITNVFLEVSLPLPAP